MITMSQKPTMLTSLFIVIIAVIGCSPTETASLLKDKDNLSMTILRLKQQNEDLSEEISVMSHVNESQKVEITTLQQKQDKLLQDYIRLSDDLKKKNEELERLKQNSSTSRVIFESKSISNKH
jgi:cell division protein FtsB